MSNTRLFGACILTLVVAAAPVPGDASAKRGATHVTLLNRPPAQVVTGGTWTARLRIRDRRGAPAWGAPAQIGLKEIHGGRLIALPSSLSRRDGLALVTVRYPKVGDWILTGVTNPPRWTAVLPAPSKSVGTSDHVAGFRTWIAIVAATLAPLIGATVMHRRRKRQLGATLL